VKIRGVFLIFATGIICLPMALLVLVSLIVSSPHRPPDSRTSFTRIVAAERAVQESVAEGPDGELVAKKGASIPDWLDLVVVANSGTGLVSSVPRFGVGSAVRETDLEWLRSAAFPGSRILIQRITRRGVAVGAFAARFDAAPLALEDDPASPFYFIAYLLCLATVALIFSWVFGARLSGSFRRLERAAERIASGDLGEAVSEKGFREMRALAAAMERMRLSLADERARRNRFLASVSHDLRTPLTSVRGYIEALEDGVAEDAETASRYLAIMREKTDALGERIDELLDFARMGTGEWRLRLVDIDLGSWLDAACAGYREDASAAGRNFEARIGDAAGRTVRADVKMLKRALENVFTNALRYSPPGGEVALVAEADGEAIELSFEDSGPGIPADELSRIFDPYFRGSGSRGEGVGLGLSIARAIVADHGWSIRAEAREGGGSVLTIRIAPPGPGRIIP